MNQVALLSIVFMSISCVTGFGIPVVLLLYFRIRKKADILPFFVGCVVMLLFAFTLEQSAHRVILGSSVGQGIQSNLWLYALYSGFMAGAFEETGRYLAFRTVLRRKQKKDINALMYGAGHGGFEALVILGVSSIKNIYYSVMINTGNIEALTGSLTGSTRQHVEGAISTLITTPSYHFLLGAVERIFAIALQLSLSVLVWFAAKNKFRRWLYPLAIALHCIVDTLTVLFFTFGMSVFAVETIVGILAVLYILLARKVWIMAQKPEIEGQGQRND